LIIIVITISKLPNSMFEDEAEVDDIIEDERTLLFAPDNSAFTQDPNNYYISSTSEDGHTYIIYLNLTRYYNKLTCISLKRMW